MEALKADHDGTFWPSSWPKMCDKEILARIHRKSCFDTDQLQLSCDGIYKMISKTCYGGRISLRDTVIINISLCWSGRERYYLGVLMRSLSRDGTGSQD